MAHGACSGAFNSSIYRKHQLTEKDSETMFPLRTIHEINEQAMPIMAGSGIKGRRYPQLWGISVESCGIYRYYNQRECLCFV